MKLVKFQKPSRNKRLIYWSLLLKRQVKKTRKCLWLLWQMNAVTNWTWSIVIQIVQRTWLAWSTSQTQVCHFQKKIWKTILNWSKCSTNLMLILESCSFQWIRRVSKPKNMVTLLNVKWDFLRFMVSYTSMVTIITHQKKKKKCLRYRKKF